MRLLSSSRLLCGLSVILATSGGCGADASHAENCTDFGVPEDFWQQKQAPPRQEQATQVEMIIRCDVLDGMSETEVVQLLGPPIDMARFGTTTEEQFRVWAYPTGPGLNVEFRGPGNTVSLVSEQQTEDPDF